jgi:dephospho-CoA kinase
MAVKRPLCIGLTGGIGSGKTTVANFFKKLGITIIDADEAAREITMPGAVGYTAILNHFGEKILAADSKQLDRQKLRRMIFQSQADKNWLEQTLHPLILQIIRERAAKANSPYCLVVIPLLVETSLSTEFLDRVCVVDASPESQQRWAAQRDQVSSAEIAAIMATQASREQRLKMADDVIINDQDFAALNRQIINLHHQYLQMVLA